MSYLDKKIEAALKDLSVDAKTSQTGKIVKKFDSSEASKPLHSFLSLHPSCRVVFNAMVKSGFVNAVNMDKLKYLAKTSATSFLVEARCKRCDNTLDGPNLADVDFRIKEKKISCPKCHNLNYLVSTEYAPSYETINREMLLRVLRKGEQVGFLTLYLSFECPFCGNTEILPRNEVLSIDPMCPRCNAVRESLVRYIPTYLEEMNSLAGEGQGYWLEWYLWKMLATSFPAEPALTLVKDGDSLEVDSAFFVNDKLSILESRDSSDASDFLEKLPLLNKISDIVLLATTVPVRRQTLGAARKLLGRKFHYIDPRKLENICEIVAKL